MSFAFSVCVQDCGLEKTYSISISAYIYIYVFTHVCVYFIYIYIHIRYSAHCSVMADNNATVCRSNGTRVGMAYCS